MRIFSKSFDEIAKEDIDELINEDYPEDLFVEYKRKLSKDTWQNNQALQQGRASPFRCRAWFYCFGFVTC